MSTLGRGRGYTGRHHVRESRPGDGPDELGRTLAELAPRVSDPKIEIKEKKKETEMEKEIKEDRKEKCDVKYHLSAEDEAALKELLFIDEQYAPLLALLEQFSPGEDGIQFNRKLRNFESSVASMCPDEPRLQAAFASFRAAALLSASAARKLAAVGASFTRQQRQQLLRGALLNVVMQGTFSKLELLQRADPTLLINAANLMGDYFAEARLCNGDKVHILAQPLLHYARALLAAADARAHRSLATQLMQNGRELLSVLAQELDDLSISIRLRLLSPPPVSVIWLLLSADLCLNKFLPLPNTLQQFYASHLELTTDESYSEVSYGSWKKEKDGYRSDSSDLADKVSQNVSQLSLNQDEDAKPKLRPILGAGAGLLRQEHALSVSQDTFDTWTSKSSLTKRYDLNSWRQEEMKREEETLNQMSKLPHNSTQNFPTTVPDYPPPPFNNCPPPQENFVNYLQQGDGAYIQNQYPNNQNFTSQGDFVPPYQNEMFEKPFAPATPTQDKEQTQVTQFPTPFPTERPMPERVNNEIQKSRRPIENWRKEKGEVKEDLNRNKPKNWTRQRSRDNISEDDEQRDGEKFKNRSRPLTRVNMRSSAEESRSGVGQSKSPRRHVTEVPRSHKYWDHDDRCDKDYSS